MKTRKRKLYKKKRTLRLYTLQMRKGGEDKDERQLDFVVNNSVFNASQDKKDKKEEKEDAFSNKDNYKGRTVLNVYKHDNKTLSESFYKADELIASILLGFNDVNPTYLPQYKKQIEFNIKNGRKKKDEKDKDVDSVNKYTYDLVFHESPFNVGLPLTKENMAIFTNQNKSVKTDEPSSESSSSSSSKSSSNSSKSSISSYSGYTFTGFEGGSVLPTDRVIVEIHAKNDMDALEMIRESVTQVDESLAGLSKEAQGYKLHILPKYKKSVKIANKHGLNIFDKTRKDIGKSNADTRKDMRQKMLYEPIPKLFKGEYGLLESTGKFAESTNNNVFKPVYNKGVEVGKKGVDVGSYVGKTGIELEKKGVEGIKNVGSYVGKYIKKNVSDINKMNKTRKKSIRGKVLYEVYNNGVEVGKKGVEEIKNVGKTGVEGIKNVRKYVGEKVSNIKTQLNNFTEKRKRNEETRPNYEERNKINNSNTKQKQIEKANRESK